MVFKGRKTSRKMRRGRKKEHKEVLKPTVQLGELSLTGPYCSVMKIGKINKRGAD